MFSAVAVSTAIDFKTITIAYSISALVVSIVLLLYLFAALFYFVKNCVKILQCIEINCAIVPFSLKCCLMYIHMYFMVIISQISRCADCAEFVSVSFTLLFAFALVQLLKNFK